MRDAVVVPCYGLHPLLWQVMEWIRLEHLVISLGVELTSAFRPIGEGESGIHATNPLRAVDFYVVSIFTGYRQPSSWHEELEEAVNNHWIYDSNGLSDPKRLKYRVAWWHDAGSGLHLHLQAHNNTVERHLLAA